MPATARRYGLVLGERADERTDPEKATRTAARHLAHLRFELGGDTLLAVAAYHSGENGVRPLLRQLEQPFADGAAARLLERNLLPPQSTAYVARFVAVAVLGEWGVPSEAALGALSAPR
jgi:membrane-bound lytic murein transglycosylase D